jgi:preprotein translocase subunit SecF
MVKLAKLYDTKYKQIILIPITMFLIALIILSSTYYNTGEFVGKDITLTGGLMISVQTKEDIDIESVEEQIAQTLDSSVRIKELKSFGTAGRIGYSFEIEKTTDMDAVKTAISDATGLALIDGNHNIEETSSSLSQSFWQNTVKALLLAFFFMAGVIFVYFRKLVPSSAIILAALSDFVCTLAAMNLLGIKLSTASVAALLMLLGYSVDSNILLSVRVIKRKAGTVAERIAKAIKTGVTMSITTLIALSTIYFITPSRILQQIAIVLILGLIFDFINTWIQNAAILRWWLGKKENV